jgi:hypothetical protein
MKPVLLASLALTLLATSPTLLALAKCGKANGNVNIGQVRLACMDVKGSATLNRSVMTGPLSVEGPLNASETKLMGSITVKGPVILDKSIVYGPAFIIGLLQTEKTTFKDKITITSANLIFTDSTTQEIDVKSSQPVILELNNTTVNGNIVFVNQNGFVKNNNSTILGKVIGGKVTMSMLKDLKGKPGAIKVQCSAYNPEAAKSGDAVCDTLMIASL